MIYDTSGMVISEPLDNQGRAASRVYDVSGKQLFGKKEWGFVPRHVVYDGNLITDALIANATSQRNALLAQYNQSDDAIPFFIETDAHGRLNDGNKLCQNLAEPIMGHIANFQLGDWGSFYSNGEDAEKHHWDSFGIVNYIPAIGNHELLANNSASAPIADLSVLIDSFTPYHRILGSSTYGYYKVMDARYRVKYLVFQPHIVVPKTVNDSGFLFKMLSDQWEWGIREMEANDGYDIVIVNHEPFPGTYTSRSSGNSFVWGPVGWEINFTPVLKARKAKQAGVAIDGDGNEHEYDFAECNTDILCGLYGHMHAEGYAEKSEFGFPAYYGDDFDSSGKCAYGLIDRDGGKLYIYSFSKTELNDPLVLDL